MRYTAGWNMPGYMPDTDPETFNTWDMAVEYIIASVEGFFEEDMESVTWAPTSEQDRLHRDLLVNWNPIRNSLNNMQYESGPPRLSYMAMTLSGDLCFWIVPVSEIDILARRSANV
jgi:hypothetical protein